MTVSSPANGREEPVAVVDEMKGPAAVKMELGSDEVDEEVLWARIKE
jgi:hypothetical protein